MVSVPTAARAHVTASPRPRGSGCTTTADGRTGTPSERNWAICGFAGLITTTTRSIPAAAASSSVHCSRGLPATGSSSFGTAAPTEAMRVPRPPQGMTAVVT